MVGVTRAKLILEQDGDVELFTGGVLLDRVMLRPLGISLIVHKLKASVAMVHPAGADSLEPLHAASTYLRLERLLVSVLEDIVAVRVFDWNELVIDDLLAL